jgi:hypothetical protein
MGHGHSLVTAELIQLELWILGLPMRETSLVFSYDQQVISGADDRPPLPSGKGLKFIVDDPLTGNRSSTWRIWTGKNVDDVCVCETKSGGRWKASLHNEWGTWRIAMTREAAEKQGIPRLVLSEQERRMPVEGWSEWIAILIPCADLRFSSEWIPNHVIRIPTSPAHSAVGIRLLLQEPGIASYQPIQEAFGLGALMRSNGGAVYVFAEPVALCYEQHESLAEFRSDARRSVPPEHRDGRFIGILAMDDQHALVDLALG